MQDNDRNFRFNFIANVLDGSFFGAALGFASFVTVIPLYVSGLTNSAVLIGLIPAIHAVGWQLPQLFTASRIARLRRYKPAVLTMTTFERLPFLGLAILAWASTGLDKRAILLITFTLLILQGFSGGLTATAWQSMIAKIIPFKVLGTFYGVQSAFANLFASIGAIVAGFILDSRPSPLDFTLCFALASICMAISLGFLSLTREQEHILLEESQATRQAFWSSLTTIIRRDINFRWFLLCRVLTQFSTMGFAFYAVYAVNTFSISERTIGIMTGLLMATQVLANPILGWLGDRRGHLLALQIGILATIISTGLAWLARGPGWFFPIFLFAGIANVSSWTVPMAMTIEFSPPELRTSYIGLANTLIAPSTFFAPVLGGLIADQAGYPITFLFSGMAGIITFFIASAIRNPRHHLQKTLIQTQID